MIELAYHLVDRPSGCRLLYEEDGLFDAMSEHSAAFYMERRWAHGRVALALTCDGQKSRRD